MLIADTEKLRANTSLDVIVAAAGTGSRMAAVSRDLHKALLPYKERPVLWHILSQIPPSLSIGILLGHKSAQIRDFLAEAFPEHDFDFIYVDDWTSNSSGTAHSLKLAKNVVKDSFWYLPCDGIFSEQIFHEQYEESTVFVKEVAGELCHHYQTLDISESNHLVSSTHKQKRLKPSLAFTGIMYVKGRESFFRELESSGEREFANRLPEGAKVRHLSSWKDMGNEETYKIAIQESGSFDFSKPDEFTFVLPNKILKWSAKPEEARLRAEKPHFVQGVFPSSVRASGEFFVYQRVDGDSFYADVTSDRFASLLSWLEERLWKKSVADISESCKLFYEEKTLERIEKMSSRLSSNTYHITSVNGNSVEPWRHYFEKIDWTSYSSNPFVAPIHGDLQFDNIIFNKEDETFRLIDWRTSFGKETVLGDVHYDFAKLLGGIFVNYKAVKNNEFTVTKNRGDVQVTIPSAKNPKELQSVLECKALELGLNLQLIHEIVPLIFWNMAPLHSEPFALALWALGLEKFEEIA